MGGKTAASKFRKPKSKQTESTGEEASPNPRDRKAKMQLALHLEQEVNGVGQNKE
jgi:hypothetical protein